MSIFNALLGGSCKLIETFLDINTELK